VITAVAALPKRAYFVTVGYGRGGEELTACALAASVKDRVMQLPSVPQAELMNYTADADIGVIPLRDVRSHRFACPGKLFEYIGAGLPLVVSDMPDLQRFVAGYGLGEVFKSGDTSDLARALGALAESFEYRRQCSQRCRALHESTVCWEVQSGKMCDIILR
jgi:glycosyltransferase involved in cell wall biosynthesis